MKKECLLLIKSLSLAYSEYIPDVPKIIKERLKVVFSLLTPPREKKTYRDRILLNKS